MKKLLLILILTLNFQTLPKADDIKDFEMEGISIGDSLLNFYKKSELDKIERFYYPNSRKFIGLYSEIFNRDLKTYDAIQFSVDPDSYKIEAIAGLNYSFKNNKKKCYREMEKIFNEIQSLFPNSSIEKEKEDTHTGDPSGKSIVKVYIIYLTNGRIQVTCTDWAEHTEKWDTLKISIHTKEHMEWINNEAYD